VRPWLFTIARNRCHDHNRRLRRRPESFCEVDSYEAPDAAHENQGLIIAERRDALHDALAQLPKAERHLLDEHWFGERAFAEIAARDGLQPSTVRVRAFRACQRLREMISVRHSVAA
jgi:RNA polymerase sigma-70 factor (ECF subfamily)